PRRDVRCRQATPAGSYRVGQRRPHAAGDRVLALVPGIRVPRGGQSVDRRIGGADMTRTPLPRRLYARLSGRRAVAHATHRLIDVEVRRRRRQAEAWRALAWDSPPLTEWEVMAMYGVVEAERMKG